MHAKRVQSLANAALGLLHAEELILHKIGAGLAQAMGLNKKHTTKQVDRLLRMKRCGTICKPPNSLKMILPMH